MQPVVIAVQSILYRQLRSLNELTIGSYTSFSMVLMYGLLALTLPGQGMGFTAQFQFYDWLLVALMGLSSSLLQIFRAKAGQYEEPAKLASVNYSQSVIQLLFDILIFNTVFSLTQVIGIAVVLAAICVKWALEV